MKYSEKKDPGNLYFTEGGFLFDPVSGVTFTLNKTASFIFNKLRSGESEESILEELIKKFNVEKNNARADLTEFAKQIKEFELIKGRQK